MRFCVSCVAGKIHISTAADDAEVKVILVSVIRGLYARMCQRLLRADASALGFLLAVRFLLISGSIPMEEFDFLLDLGVDLSGASSPLAARHPPSDDQQQHEEPPEELDGQDPLLTPEVTCCVSLSAIKRTLGVAGRERRLHRRANPEKRERTYTTDPNS